MAKNLEEREYLTIRQAAKYLSIPEPALRVTIRCGKIPVRRAAGRRPALINRRHLLPFLCPLLEGNQDEG
jgi:excisionase family DNA binding protein